MVRLLLAAYPQVALREQTEETYIRWLLDLDPGVVSRAIEDLIASSAVLPTIAEIRHAAMEETVGVPTALGAWVSLMEREGELHDLTKQVVKLFGGTWGIRTSAEPSITRAHFLKVYEAERERWLRRENAAHFRRLRLDGQAA